MSDSPYVRVADSGIHGTGVFAAKRIPKGRDIIEYVGKRKRWEGEDTTGGLTYLMQISKNMVIDGAINGNAARFINHSCNPNTETTRIGNRVYITALRTIPAGEELTYDYKLSLGQPPDDEDMRLWACRCGAEECRTTMLDPEELAAFGVTLAVR